MILRLTDWNEGFNGVRCVHLLRQHKPISLTEAKSIVDGILNGRQYELELLDIEEARRFIIESEKIGMQVIFVGKE